MELQDRKKDILEAIVELYVSTAEPVGSRTLAKSLPLSPATIRNEMSDLEELDLLEKQHSSSGRVPSDLGYRVYVDQLMKRYDLNKRESETLKSLMQLKISEVRNLMHEVTEIYSHLMNCTVFAITPKQEQDYIKHLQLMPIDDNLVLLALVTNSNKVKTKQVLLNQTVDSQELAYLTEILNNYISGRRENNITLDEMERIQIELGAHSNVLVPILNFISQCIDEIEDTEIFIRGATNLLGLPEYGDIEKAREILEFLDSPVNLYRIYNEGKDNEIKILIGRENSDTPMQNCSIVSSRYNSGGEKRGTIGIIGPTRMNYARATSMLEFFIQHLNEGG